MNAPETAAGAPAAVRAPGPGRTSAGVDAGRLAERLARETGGEVRFDPASRGRYATDASIYQVMPIGVFVPRDADDVAAAIAIARELGAPILPRGAGTSQCGQTTGAALVIDASKHLRQVLAVDADARTAVVEPGLVLDALNAKLKPLGLWFPVDVSTSAQATLGGMAGNNSCGSRSIAYGNMVHNVLAIDAWLSDGSAVSFGPLAGLGAKERAIADFVRGLADECGAEIEARWPKVMRRVGGYNLDIFRPRSERPYCDDGSVNLAHLLVGSEGTLAVTRRLTLKLAPLPAAKVLGVVNFPTFRAAMAAAEHLVTLGPTAVELVDRTMIELARANPAFRTTIEAALTGSPAAILLVEFSGDDKATLLRRLKELVALVGDLGLPGAVVEIVGATAQKALWEVRKAGLNIMMSLKGDGKPVSFIEDCAVPLEHLADYTDALTEVFTRHGTRGTWYAHASVGTLHVRPILDMRQGGAAKMRAIAEEAGALVRRFKGAYSGEHGDGLCRGEWIAWQFGPRIDAAFRALKHRLDPIGLLCPNRIVDPPKMDDPSLFRYPPGYRTIALTPVLDWSAWNVHERPGDGSDQRARQRRRPERRPRQGGRDVQQQRPLPQVRCRHDVPELPRHPRRAAPDARPRQHPAPGADRAARGRERRLAAGERRRARGARAVRELQGLPARLPDRRRHGADEDRGDRAAQGPRRPFAARPAGRRRCPTLPRPSSRLAWLANLRNRSPLARAPGRALARPRGTAAAAALAAAVVRAPRAGARPRRPRRGARGRPGRGPVRRHLQRRLRAGERRGRGPRPAGRGLRGARSRRWPRPALLRPDLPRRRNGRARARPKARALLDALLPFAERGIAIVGLEPSCLLTLRDEMLVMGLGEAAQTVAGQALLFEEFVAREARAGRLRLALRPREPADPRARPLPPEGVRGDRRRCSRCCASFPARRRR